MSTTNITKNDAGYGDGDVVMPHNIGHLLKEPTEIECPACEQRNVTRIEREAVTCLQRLVAVLNFCFFCCPIRWSGRHDINHYCSRCGCFIGRFIALSWSKKKLFKIQHSGVEDDNMWQHFRKVPKEELDKRKQQTFIKSKQQSEEGEQS